MEPDSIASTAPAESPEYPFQSVRMNKFVVLNLLTFGLYSIVWFFRMWNRVKRSEDGSLWPWARAVFGGVFYYSLLKRLDVRSPVLLAVGYFAVLATWRLPSTYWLASLLAFVFLIPAVRAANRLNPPEARHEPSALWRARDGVVVGLGLLFLPLALLGTLGPSASVVAAPAIAERHLDYLEELGVLGPEEEPLFFYSAGLLSIKNDGVLVSDWGVTSYWVDPVTDDLVFAAAAYPQIVDVEVNPAAHSLDVTVVRISVSDGTWFIFGLSPEGGVDQELLLEIDRRRVQVGDMTITAW